MESRYVIPLKLLSVVSQLSIITIGLVLHP